MERSLTCTYVAAAGFLIAAADPALDGETQPWMKEGMTTQEVLFRPVDLMLQGCMDIRG